SSQAGISRDLERGRTRVLQGRGQIVGAVNPVPLYATQTGVVGEVRVVPYTGTPDTISGYLRSTAFLSSLASDRSSEQFEAELRRALLDYDPSGLYEETMAFYYIIGRRPD